MERLVGYRFHPTDEELIDHYLTKKILGSNTWLLHEAMSEIDIYKFDPWDLRAQSKISSKDPVWYFFSPRDTTNPKKKGTKRTTNAGYWKATGVDRKIRRKGNSGEIGVKKTLVFYLGRTPNGVRTPYVMHEYHSSLSSPDQRTYVICKVKYKGEDADIPSGSGSEPSHSMASNLNNVEDMSTGHGVHQEVQGTPESFYGFSENDLMMSLNDQVGLSLSEVQSLNQFGGNSNLQLQTPYWTQNENELTSSLMDHDQEYWCSVFGDPEPALYKLMQENCNDYRPQKALTGVYVDSSSDSDAESISATSYQETPSPVDSVGSLNGHYQTDVNEIVSLKDLKELVATSEYTSGRKTREFQSLPKHSRGETHGHPTRSPLLGKYQRVVPSKQEVEKVIERPRAAAPSMYERQSKMGQDMNKKSSLAITEKEYWFVSQDAIEKSRKHPRYIYLSNTIIGFILFVVLIHGIISVH